jgi:hypothetical protein
VSVSAAVRRRRPGTVAGVAVGVTAGACVALLGRLTAAAVGGAIGVLAALTVARASDRARWVLVYGLIVGAVFGPLLDLLTGMPVVWVVGAGVLVAAVGLAWREAVDVPAPRTRSWVELALLLYLGYYLLQIVRLGDRMIAGLLLFREPVIAFATYWIVWRLLNRDGRPFDDRLSQLARLVVACGTLAAAYGIFQYLAGFENLRAWGLLDPTSWYIHRERGLSRVMRLGEGVELFRISGPMRRNESFAFFLVFDMAMWLVLIAEGRIRRVWAILHALLVGIALVLAFSLAALLHAGMLLAVALVVRLRAVRRAGVWALAAAGVLAIMLNAATGGVLTARVIGHAWESQHGMGRLGIMQNFLRELTWRPPETVVLGSGITSSDEGTLERLRGVLGAMGLEPSDLSVERESAYAVSDSLYAYLVLDLGVIGLVLFLAPLLLMAGRVALLYAGSRNDRLKCSLLILALYVATMIPQGLLNTMYLVMPLPVLFWTAIAFLDAGTLAVGERHALAPA